MKLAVCTVTQNEEGELLIVARKDNPDDWNLPGGKVEDHETLEEAAERELFEETGLRASMGDMCFLRVFVDLCGDWGKTVCVCFLTHSLTGELAPQPGEAQARWGSWDDITSEKSLFHDYNRKLYEELKKQGFVR